ncbi:MULTISPECIES: hypothetical protein [Actinosynnema]|nr:hypothetical protein [Actinosynnema pretiosum]MCP2097398.1 hypothetical protein [Actinosynnema pretiosum]
MNTLAQQVRHLVETVLTPAADPDLTLRVVVLILALNVLLGR